MLLSQQESAYSLLRIVDDILSYSKIEARTRDIDREPMCLHSLAESVAKILTANAVKSQIRFQIYIDPAIPSQLLGDKLRLRQILFKLTIMRKV